MASNYPKTIGSIPTQDIDSQWFRRVSAKQQEKNRDIKNVQPTNYVLPRAKPSEPQSQQGMFHPDYMSTKHDSFRPKNLNGEIEDVTTRFQPDYVYMDRHTLRFYGFFQESVTESNVESYRVRNVVIYFYLEDNTISMIEPKQMNSGIPQGVFLKRQKVLKQDNSGRFFGIEDFQIGEQIQIFGKNIKLTGCDQYTQEFYDCNGFQQQPNQQVDILDQWTEKTLNKPKPVKDGAMTDYMEHKLGGGKPNPAKQFLENDRKVLKFYVNSGTPYILHYYLADDTVEIREINFQNSGKDPFPLLLRRQKQPRKFALNQPGQTYAEDYIKPSDIKYGDFLDIFGRKFEVQGCDPYTNRYYNEKFQIDFPVGSISQPQPKGLPNRVIPPYNGFGNEEDSLGYVYRLVPKAPKKDFFKWVDNQVNLRFWAKFNTNKPEDIHRRFIITFFLNDDSLMVYEPDQRNSGQVSGKFLERRQYKNVQKNNAFFLPTDFIVGRDIILNGRSFNLEEADDFTKNWFAKHVTVRN